MTTAEVWSLASASLALVGALARYIVAEHDRNLAEMRARLDSLTSQLQAIATQVTTILDRMDRGSRP